VVLVWARHTFIAHLRFKTGKYLATINGHHPCDKHRRTIAFIVSACLLWPASIHEPVEEDAALCQTAKSLVRYHSSLGIIFRHKTIGRWLSMVALFQRLRAIPMEY
jgi:hypothetical protein